MPPEGSLPRAILDTSVLIGPATSPREWENAISVVSIAELRFGVLVARNGATRAQRLRRLTATLQVFDPLPVDDAVADAYAEMAAEVRERGRQPRARQFDLLIAATAAAHGATLMTHNVADFAGLERFIQVVSPSGAG